MKPLFLTIAAGMAAVTLLWACADAGSLPTSTRPAGKLTISTPAQGAVLSTQMIRVTGRGPAGSKVVRDVSFALDDEVIVGTDGGWSMEVQLDEGPNDLVFRIGDDTSTEMRLGVTYERGEATQPAVPSNDATVGASDLSTPASPTTSQPAASTAAPTPPPAPQPSFLIFGDGTHEVGTELRPGTYRLREPALFCYWARLSGFGGTLGEIIANENVADGYAVVTIAAADKGFESNGCGEWSSDLSQIKADRESMEAGGTYIVGTDILAGTWRSAGGELCYWARLRGFGGVLGEIIANDNVFGAPTIVKISSTDAGFHTTGCGTWTRTGP
jgi:hypothetical protein